MMSAAWLTYPLSFTGMRMFECGDLTTEECDYYKQRWHFWYIADYVYTLPAVAFFMVAIGLFIIANILSTLLSFSKTEHTPHLYQKLLALLRYLSYRGFHILSLRWNSAPVGVLLLAAAGTIFFFCMDLAPKPYYWPDEKFGGSPPLATRSGWLALGCMPFVFATASKTNWITLLTGVSHERLQVFHRWIAYAFFILALLHTFPFIVYHVHWKDMQAHFSESLLFYWTGIVALVFQAWLTFMSHSTIRSLGYEFFKISHFAAVVVFMITFFWHCDYTLTSWHYFVATAAVYVPCFVYPWLRTIFEYRLTQKAYLHAEANGFTRISIPVSFYWTPGQHCFLRFTSFGILNAVSAHPFTICSCPPMVKYEKSELVFYIRHQKGFTAKLYQHALDHPDTAVNVMVDGPYGGVNMFQLTNADDSLVIAGGSGAGWCLPFVERFLRRSSSLSGSASEDSRAFAADEKIAPVERTDVVDESASQKTLSLILATRDSASRVWFEHAVDELMSMYGVPKSGSVQVQVYLTGHAAEGAHLPRDKETTPSSSASSSSGKKKISDPETGISLAIPGQEHQGRPDLSLIIKDRALKAKEESKALSVYVCGPETMQNDVRNAVAAANLDILSSGSGSVYLHSEHFSWA